MKRKIRYSSWIVPLTLVMVLLVGLFSPISNAMQQKKKIRKQLSIAQQLDRLAAKSGENAILPVLMYGIERYLQGAPVENEVDRAVQSAFARHTRLKRQLLQTVLNNWKALAPATKARLVPAELRNLNAAQKLDMNTFRSVLRKAAAKSTPEFSAMSPNNALIASTYTQTMPYLRGVYGSAGPKGPMTDPDGTPRIVPGKGFMLDAERVGGDKSKIKIDFVKTTIVNGHASNQVIATVAPNTASVSGTGDVTTITGTAPAKFDYGDYKLKVELIGVGSTNAKRIDLAVTDFNLKSKITGVGAQYPGNKTSITGASLPKQATALLAAIQDANVTYSVPVKYVNDTSLEMTLPQDVFPADYHLTLTEQGKTLTNAVKFTIRAPRYQVRFNKMKCLDESDPEVTGDELVTFWGIGADGNGWDKHTGEYEDFGDGVEEGYQAQDQLVFPITGTGEVSRYLNVTTNIFEWDAGDVESANEALGAIGDAAVGIGTAAGGAGTVIGAIIKVVMGLIGAIVKLFGGDPDNLGLIALQWTAPDLQKLTAAGSFSSSIKFINDDDTGSYELSYTITRQQP